VPASEPALTLAPADLATPPWREMIDKLEKRVRELELTRHPPLENANEDGGGANSGSPARPAESIQKKDIARFDVLVGKGQSLLSLKQPAEALACFEQALALEPNRPELLVKQGTALEQLGRLDEAIECYDRAIAVDDSMTLAYLFKGGLFNRMQRFMEALECYERALRNPAKKVGNPDVG